MRFAFQAGLFVLVLSVSLQAQHGGGRGGHAVSHSSFSSHSFSSGFRPATGFTGTPSTGFTGRPSTGFASAGESFYRHPSYPNFGRNVARGRRAYVPFLYGAYFDPFYSSFDSTYDYEPGSYAYPSDSGEQTAEVTANLLGEQLERLSDQVQQLGAQQFGPPATPQGYYYPAAPPNVPVPNTAPEPAPVLVTVVLHNGQQIQVRNYAIMGDSFWDFSKQPARRIPLSSVDIAASKKATEANGGQFPNI
jgi:hypothetical protein